MKGISKTSHHDVPFPQDVKSLHSCQTLDLPCPSHLVLYQVLTILTACRML